MKKIISLLTIVSLLVQYAFVVYGAEEQKPFLELDAEALAVAKAHNINCISVVENENGEVYALLNDDDPISECGVTIPTGVPSSDIITATFDYYIEPDSKSGIRFYWNSNMGNCVALTLYGKPGHYSQDAGGPGSANADLQVGTWENITVVLNRPKRTFNLYLNGTLIGENFILRKNNAFDGGTNLIIMGDKNPLTKVRIKNLKFYNEEVIPNEDPVMKLRAANPERFLVDYARAKDRVDAVLKGAVAMTIGNSVARVDNRYVNIYEGEPYVAPYISADGSTLIPARFATEAIGCEVEVVSLTQFKIHKDGTTIEFNTGDKNAIINGRVIEMPTAPVITRDRLFVPLRFAAETFGKKVFWDDRGLIVISDGESVKPGQEDIIKPLINDIRNRSGAFGNKNYSDVSMSSRTYGDGTRNTFEATKDFMATVDRWTYTINGDGLEKMLDQGTFVHGTVNASVRDGDEPEYAGTAQFFDGTWYQRADGANGNTWGCVSNPVYRNNVLMRAKRGIDSNLFMWQFDDWQLALNYYLGGCFCDYCMIGFRDYLINHKNDSDIAPLLEKAGFGNLEIFNFKEWIKAKGVTTNGDATNYTANYTPSGELLRKFNEERVLEFHTWLKAEMESYSGGKINYSLNTNSSFSTMAKNDAISPWYIHMIDINEGTMGESEAEYMTASSVYASMLLNKAMGVENCISPLPKSEYIARMMICAIPMVYATGQFMLVPWDAWLYGTTRYYATPEELKGLYEFVRKYPHLFDNYENPEKVAYVMDLQATNPSDANNFAAELLEKGTPAKLLLHRSDKYGTMTFDINDLKGISAVVAATDTANLSDAEKTLLASSGIPFIEKNDVVGRKAVEDKHWTVRNEDEEIYTTLRTNQLYDDAPIVVHAVNYVYDTVCENVEIEINNEYLPQGETVNVKIYRPNQNPYTTKVRKGDSSTVITIDKMEFWSVLEISGSNTVRNLSSFDIGGNYSGIGMGTRVSNDKAFGVPENFNIITYSEGINSTTYGDVNGCQDEVAFVYKHLGKSKIKSYSAFAGFEDAEGAHGVMIRDGVRSNVKFAALVYDKANGLRFAHREYVNKGVVYTPINGAHTYMKLEMEQGKIIAYSSYDGKKWERVYECEIDLTDPVAGVFASSPDGTRSVHTVKDFYVSDGKNPSEDFETFKIKYKDGRIHNRQTGERIDIRLSTKNYDNISADDVDISFKSSDASVAEITPNGYIIPKKTGKTTITATARMGLRSITATTELEVYPAPKEMYIADFDTSDDLNPFRQGAEAGKVELVDGAVRLSSVADGGPAQTAYMRFDQVSGKNACFEFDFRAHFGKTQPTTGAGVIYGNNDGFALTCDVNKFNWFFGSEQRFVAPMEGDRWYHIKIYINYDEQWANVWIDDKLVVDKGELKSYAGQSGTFKIRAWRLGLDTYYEWDNFNFSIE